MRRNKTSEAGTISIKVGKLIAETRAQQLSKVNYKDVKKLWASVRSITTHSRPSRGLISSTGPAPSPFPPDESKLIHGAVATSVLPRCRLFADDMKFIINRPIFNAVLYIAICNRPIV